MKPNDNFKYLCPLPFDNFPFVEGSFESLTEYGYIQKMVKAYNNLVIVVKQHQEFIDNYESQIDEIENQINAINIKLNGIDDKIDAKLDEVEDELKQMFNDLSIQVISLINNNYNILKNYIDDLYADLEQQIQNISIDSIVLRDPTTGLYSNIQVVVNNLFNTFNIDALTAYEFDALEYTATNFDATQITAYEFDTQGKTILTN